MSDYKNPSPGTNLLAKETLECISIWTGGNEEKAKAIVKQMQHLLDTGQFKDKLKGTGLVYSPPNRPS